MKKAIAALVVLVLLVAVVGMVPAQMDARAQQSTEAAPAAGTGEIWTATHIAQQDFQKGFMFWISTTKKIWVLTKTNPADTQGEWRVFDDTFVNGDPESDPALDPTLPALYQPHRGFGKLWRNQETGLRDALGYGTTPEFELTTPMSYLSGVSGLSGTSTSRYLLITLGEQVFALYENTPGQPGGRWQMVGQVEPGPNVVQSATTAAPASTADASSGIGAVAAPTQAATP